MRDVVCRHIEFAETVEEIRSGTRPCSSGDVVLCRGSNWDGIADDGIEIACATRGRDGGR